MNGIYRMSKAYDVEVFTVTLNTLAFHILYIPFNFPANYIIDRWGFVPATIFASVCFIGGGWIRYIGSPEQASSFWFILLGSSVAACGVAFVLSTPPKIATVWFGDKERTKATTIGSLSSPVGVIIGFVLPSLFLSQDYPNGHDAVWPEDEKLRFREEMKDYILW